jgi:broad specificity phosphatase PhoE
MALVASRSWAQRVRSVFASNERKAKEGAGILAEGLRLHGYSVVDGLQENDRSATGYLPPEEFEHTVCAFFARPEVSVRGWEPAVHAQARIVGAVKKVISLAPKSRDIAIVGHGGTGTLLYCYFGGLAIARRHDQPATNGGNWFAFGARDLKLRHHGWRSIDDATVP